ncbi:hypothetical protein FPOAC2_05437 [Fusarium poae]
MPSISHHHYALQTTFFDWPVNTASFAPHNVLRPAPFGPPEGGHEALQALIDAREQAEGSQHRPATDLFEVGIDSGDFVCFL